MKTNKNKTTLPVKGGGMSYERFAQIWQEVWPNGQTCFRNSKKSKVIKQAGCSQTTTDLLIAYGKGEQWATDHFAKIKEMIEKENNTST